MFVYFQIEKNIYVRKKKRERNEIYFKYFSWTQSNIWSTRTKYID